MLLNEDVVSILLKRNCSCPKTLRTSLNIGAETNIRNVTNEPFSKRTNIRIFVRFDD